MSIETRREMLVRYLREHGRTSVNDLAAHFNITGATVRSDLRHLEQAQLVVRRYGGAPEAFTQPALEDHSMDEKTVLNLNTSASAPGREPGPGWRVHHSRQGSTTLQMVPWLAERVARR